jgi:integrase
MKVLTETQVRNLLLASKGTRYEALFQIAVTTGLREGEILGLKWLDFDWNSKQLMVVRQIQRINKIRLVFNEPKSAAGRRCIQLGPSMMDKLQEHLKFQSLERQFQGDKWTENNLIFPSNLGTLKDPRNLIKVFKQYLKKAGLPDIRFHDLRHPAATLMFQMGTHPKIVQERLGHSDISLTLNTYSHVMPSMQEEVANKMDEKLTLINVHEEVMK